MLKIKNIILTLISIISLSVVNNYGMDVATDSLKKEFQKRDVERLRNLVKGKYGDRTTVGIGYSKTPEGEHKEGDIWKSDGKEWTIKDGLKENITKLDKFKNLSIPIFCPKCKQNMDKQLDIHYFKSYGECLDCRATTETQLKISGKWENYVNQTFNKEHIFLNMHSTINDID
jgi:hypothetical protein